MPNKQVIRTVQRRRLADFDEQLWPINCALLVLGGFVAGLIIATSDFDGGPLWHDGWFRLSLLGASLLALLGGTLYLHRKKAVRRMQLAVLLSLLFNLGIEYWLYQTYLRLTPRDEQWVTSDWVEEE